MENAIKHIWKTIIDILVGGWDASLQIMLIVIGLDYLTGVASAFKTIVNDINYFTKRTNRGKPASRSAG